MIVFLLYNGIMCMSPLLGVYVCYVFHVFNGIMSMSPLLDVYV